MCLQIHVQYLIFYHGDVHQLHSKTAGVLTLSNRCSENSKLNFKLCVALCIAIWKSYAINEKIYFYFFIYYKFFFYLSLNLKYCVGLYIAIEKSYAKKWRKSFHKILMYANFSYKTAPKPVGRMDPSSFERV